jgi:SAM-dependent methyltransferase
MAALQAQHWWFEAKRRMAAALLTRFDVLPRAGRRIELGCGTGAMLPVLGGGTLLVGLDLELAALRYVVGADRLLADAMALPLRNASVDLTACFDLLYHRAVANVDVALGEMARVTAPGGWLLITDSAGPSIYGSHDQAHHGARRFRRRDLVGAVEAAGFAVEFAGHFHCAVWPAVAASRLGGRWLRQLLRRPAPAAGQSQLQAAPAWLNRSLGALYRLEVAVASRVPLPFGVSVVLLAQRSTAES